MEVQTQASLYEAVKNAPLGPIVPEGAETAACEVCGGKGKVQVPSPDPELIDTTVEIPCPPCRGTGRVELVTVGVEVVMRPHLLMHPCVCGRIREAEVAPDVIAAARRVGTVFPAIRCSCGRMVQASTNRVEVARPQLVGLKGGRVA